MMWKQDDHGQTVLHIAAFNGHVELIRVLLDSGAQEAVNARDR